MENRHRKLNETVVGGVKRYPQDCVIKRKVEHMCKTHYRLKSIPICQWLQKQIFIMIQCYIAMKINHGVAKLVFKKTIYNRRFFLSPPQRCQCSSILFSSFLALQVDHKTISVDVSFSTPINDAQCKARLFVLYEASKESELIAE